MCIFQHTCVNWVFASEKGCSAWGAQRWHVVVVENYAIVGESVNVWGWYLVAAVKSHVIPALIDNRGNKTLGSTLISALKEVAIFQNTRIRKTAKHSLVKKHRLLSLSSSASLNI
jgi:hypothetical protein